MPVLSAEGTRVMQHKTGVGGNALDNAGRRDNWGQVDPKLLVER